MPPSFLTSSSASKKTPSSTRALTRTSSRSSGVFGSQGRPPPPARKPTGRRCLGFQEDEHHRTPGQDARLPWRTRKTQSLQPPAIPARHHRPGTPGPSLNHYPGSKRKPAIETPRFYGAGSGTRPATVLTDLSRPPEPLDVGHHQGSRPPGVPRRPLPSETNQRCIQIEKCTQFYYILSFHINLIVSTPSMLDVRMKARILSLSKNVMN